MTESRSESLRQQQTRLAAELRSEGKTWVEVAEVFRQRFRLNPRAALRAARGWSQAQAAEEWNRRWPDEPKTHKSFSYWEIWPGKGGYTPSQDNLVRLAEIYECAVADLLADLPSFRHLDAATRATFTVARGTSAVLTGETMVPREAEILLRDLLGRRPGAEAGAPPRADLTGLHRLPEEVNFGELAQVIVMWMQRIPDPQTRRAMLGKLTAALAVATTAPLTELAGAAEPANAAPPSAGPGTFDPATLAHCEEMMPYLRKQGDVLGAGATLPSALAYRRTAEQQAKAAPAGPHRDRAIAAYAELTQLAGWLCFNMGDYGSAQRLYDDARSAAHEARAVELVTYILCTMSHLATWQGKPRIGIDHAAAATAWAEQSGSPYARAYAADVAVRALTADRQADRSQANLDREYAALQEAQADDGPRQSWWYFYDESFYWSTTAQQALGFHDADRVLAATDKTLCLIDPGNLHNRAFGLLYRAEAFAQQRDIDQACRTATEAVELTSVNSSKRITQQVQKLRRGLDPWKRTRSVKELDQAVRSYRSTPFG
ncbi:MULTISPECIES: helix-turn-helix transcriptional regulator [unclassified Micromonospora]|uniref:helix-turn-helix transcriptional regulator n=1 Tax=unclassified Micromonospora TaxID=2617518 RepID=UPI003A85E0F2